MTHPICVDCAIQIPLGPDARDEFTCDSCGDVVESLSVLTSFRVEVGRFEATLRFCLECAPGGPATYWTRDPES